MARSVSDSDTGAKRIAAVGLIVFVVACVALSIALFTSAFTSTVPITVESSRSGLVLDRDAKVKARGVEIGHVESISENPDGAVIRLAVYPDDLDSVPSNARVQIGSNTVFGAKSVDFETPAQPSPTPLEAGATVRSADVTVEINTLFERLTTLLQSTEPEKINATLGALASALDGRGDQLGLTLTDLDRYLQTVNPQIETLQRDLQKGAQTAGLYADVTPDLMRTLDAGTTVGDNLVAHQDQFESLLAGVTRTSHSGSMLLDGNGNQLIKSMHDLRAAASLVAEYSPSLSCMIIGLNKGVEENGQAFGASNQPGLVFKAGFQQGAKPYEYPKDLPKVNASTGPHCYGLPYPAKGSHAPGLVSDTGSNVLEGMPNVFDKNTDPLFGPLPAPQPGKPAPPTLLQVMLGMDQGGTR